MTVVLRACGIALIALVALFVLRSVSSGLSSFVKIGAAVLLFGLVMLELTKGIEALKEIISVLGSSNEFVGEAIGVMLKALGIALVGRICADICRECGEGGLAQGVEAVAGVVIFSLSLPILSAILSFASDVLGRSS